MTEYHSVKVKLSDSQLHTLKSATKHSSGGYNSKIIIRYDR